MSRRAVRACSCGITCGYAVRGSMRILVGRRAMKAKATRISTVQPATCYLSGVTFASGRAARTALVAACLVAATAVLPAALCPSARASCDTITVGAVGDIMLGTTYPDSSWLPPDDGAGLLSPAIP